MFASGTGVQRGRGSGTEVTLCSRGQHQHQRHKYSIVDKSKGSIKRSSPSSSLEMTPSQRICAHSASDGGQMNTGTVLL